MPKIKTLCLENDVMNWDGDGVEAPQIKHMCRQVVVEKLPASWNLVPEVWQWNVVFGTGFGTKFGTDIDVRETAGPLDNFGRRGYDRNQGVAKIRIIRKSFGGMHVLFRLGGQDIGGCRLVGLFSSFMKIWKAIIPIHAHNNAKIPATQQHYSRPAIGE